MASTEPELGDLIEIFRGSYQHWAVYVGDGFIVHLTSSDVPGEGSSSMMSSTGKKAIVKKEELWDVVGSDRWEINNSLDKQYKPRPADDIVRQACAMVGDERPYCVFSGNCEHFANELRYGKAESRQVHVVVVKARFLPFWLWPIVFLLRGSCGSSSGGSSSGGSSSGGSSSGGRKENENQWCGV